MPIQARRTDGRFSGDGFEGGVDAFGAEALPDDLNDQSAVALTVRARLR